MPTAVESLVVRVVPGDRETVIRLEGVLDFRAGDVLAHAVAAAVADGAGHMVLQLEGLTFVDAAGVGLLVGARRLAVDAGATLVACAPSTPARRVLDLTGIGAYLDGGSSIPPETASTIDSSR